MRAAAEDYVERGWPVFVLGRSKRPVANCKTCKTATADHNPQTCDCLTCHGFYAATTNLDRVHEMLARVPRGLLAIRTGTTSGLFVVDIDPRNGGQLDPATMTPTRAIKTGSDGWHLYYQHPGGVLPSQPLPGVDGVDIKADGGYVVAPPSTHPETGRPYRVAVDLEVQEIPRALRDAVTGTRSAAARATVDSPLRQPTAAGLPRPFGAGGISHPDKLLVAHLGAVARARKGSRRKTLYGAARGLARMVVAGALTHSEAVDALTDAGRAAEQTDRDIRTAVAGGFRAEGLHAA